MERRLVLFLLLTVAILGGYMYVAPKVLPQPRKAPAVAKVDHEEEKQAKKAEEAAPASENKEQPGKVAEKPTADTVEPDKKDAAIQAEPETPQQWVTLGSADSKDPYRMLVTLTNRGAAVARIDLNNDRYCDVDDRSGFLGHIIMDPGFHANGCPIEVVGPGTPAAEAGLRPGDMLKAINDKPVTDAESLRMILSKTRPNHKVQVTYARDGKELTTEVRLRRNPLEVVRPEDNDPLSLLLTLHQFDEERLATDLGDKSKGGAKSKTSKDAKELQEIEEKYREELERELEGVNLRTANWQIAAANQDEVQFRRSLPGKGIEIVKTYRLVKIPGASQNDRDYPAYNLEFDIEIRNVGDKVRKVAYQLDGPNGLPIEGRWYASKVSRNWGGAGLRDFVVSFGNNVPGMVGGPVVGSVTTPPQSWPENVDQPLKYVGVDAQYFSCVLMPQRAEKERAWFDRIQPICNGNAVSAAARAKNSGYQNLTNTSCRLVSTVNELKPNDAVKHSFQLYAGPKRPPLLEKYGLGELVYFGWPIFAMFAVPLTNILHFFFGVVCNYGLAIIMLTILVRGLMFPLSRKQALGAQKMQELQPEIKRIQEKYKKDVEGRTRAQQELFRKHNYNPMSGCLVAFIQLPIFIGLYRALMVDVELRDAPLINHAIRWCSNLAAPDMLLDWGNFMPQFVLSGQGIFGLGPYFNLLPILTIGLFIVQQKMFMPPAADEQAAMQQKIMQYMMVFMGLMFFKVASGLCIYFIASSLWGVAERQFLPKPVKPDGNPNIETRAQAKARLAAEAEQARKRKEKKGK